MFWNKRKVFNDGYNAGIKDFKNMLLEVPMKVKEKKASGEILSILMNALRRR